MLTSLGKWLRKGWRKFIHTPRSEAGAVSKNTNTGSDLKNQSGETTGELKKHHRSISPVQRYSRVPQPLRQILDRK